jgi:hypothetical protein
MLRKTLLAVMSTMATQLANAQDWDWSVTPYLWAAAVEGESGLGLIQTDVSADFADLADLFAGAALIHVEAQRDTFGLFGDLVFLSLEGDPALATVGGLTETQFDSTIVELGYLKKLSQAGLELGLRYWDFDLEMQPTTLPGIERGQDWIDGFVGVRTSREIGDKWGWTMRANLGGGGSDLSIGFDVTFGRELSSGSRIVTGLKLIDIDYDEPSANGIPFRLDTMFIGATIGYQFD